MWVPTADLPKSAGHPFYDRLNRVLDDVGFDADGVGRPSLAPDRYFRLLLLGYFEGLDSERAIAWRAADSLSIRTFLDFALHEAPPDHSTLSRTLRLIDLETHQAVFTWVLQRLADATLVVVSTVIQNSPTCGHRKFPHPWLITTMRRVPVGAVGRPSAACPSRCGRVCASTTTAASTGLPSLTFPLSSA